MDKLKVGILGATGFAGIEFIRALQDHPWFEIEDLYASEKNVGKTLSEVFELGDDLHGCFIKPEIRRHKSLKSLSKINYDLDLICSALPSDVAKDIEGQCAKYVPVISTTSAFRYEEDVPILITEINSDHSKLLRLQSMRGWKGWIAPGPNCTTVGLVMSLYPIHQEFGIEKVIMSSYQSISGGGTALLKKFGKEREATSLSQWQNNEIINSPKLKLEGNVIGHIEKETEKVKRETLKILGEYDNLTKHIPDIYPAEFSIDCQCVRVPVLKGHFETVFVETLDSCSVEGLKQAYAKFNEECKEKFGNLPSSPQQTLTVLEREPQPYYDVMVDGGMTTVIGQINPSTVFKNGFTYQVLSNNLAKGAAKGMVQVAEYLKTIDLL